MSKPKNKKNSVVGKNLIALIQLTLAGLALLFFLLSLSSFAPRIDLTEQKELSLSEYTENILTSKLSSESRVHLTCLANKSTLSFQRIQILLEEYQRLAEGNLTLELVDPFTQIERAFEITEQYGLQPTDDILIIDYLAGQRKAVIPFSDLLQYTVTDQKQRQISAYLVEDTITTHLLHLIEDKVRTVYLITDNTDSQNVSQNSIGSTLDSLYRNTNIELKPISLANLSSIPADASGLVFLTPRYDLEAAQLALLEQYWERPKASLLFLLEPRTHPKSIKAFLRRHGVSPNNDRIFLRKDEKLSTKTVANFTKGLEVNDQLQGKSTLFEGVTSTLTVREAADDLINKRIAPLTVISTSSQYYAEKRHQEKAPTFSETEDRLGPLHLGAAVIKGNEMNDQTAENSARMIILSTTDFLKPDSIRNEQIDFMRNAINWLVGRPELVGIGPKPLKRYKLNLVKEEVAFMNRLTLFILPAAFLLISAFMWNIRRS